jgi:cytochrome c-type biogenesis protein CcmH
MASLSFGTGAHGASGSLQRLRVRRAGMAATVVLVLALAAGAFLTFSHEPAMPSAEVAAAPTTADATRATDLREGLVAHLVRNPRDARSLILLARLDFSRDRFADAADAYRRAIAVNAKAEGDPGIWCEYADALGMAQGGSLAGEPRAIVLRTLARTPGFPRALEMAGSAAFEAREFADAARYWRELATQLPEEAPPRRELLAAAARADLLAGRAR